MPERQTVLQLTQVGVEATPGTAVAATRRLGAMNIDPSINAETTPFRPAGSKFPTVVTLNREWADLAYNGVPTYQEVVIPLACVFGAPTVTAITPTFAFSYVYEVSSGALDNPKTLTVEKGQAAGLAEKYAHAMLTSFSLAVSRAEVTMSGSGFARAATTGATITPGLPIPTDLIPLQPGHFTVGLLAEGGNPTTGLAAAPAMTRVVSLAPSIEDRFMAAWFVNAAQQSFTTFVENGEGVGGSWGLVVEADAAGMTLLANLRLGTTRFIRLQATGPNIPSSSPSTNFGFTWDVAVKVSAVEQFSDEDGVYAIGFALQPVHDAVLGKSQTITVTNNVSAATMGLA